MDALLTPNIRSDWTAPLWLGGLTAVAAVGAGTYYSCRHSDPRMAKPRLDGLDSKDAETTDPNLLRDHSTVRSYTGNRSGIVYPGIRVFYRPRPQIEELPKDPAPLPLLVFIHGLGGSVAQFHPLLVSLVDTASCLAIDLPGCGRSEFAPTGWDAYTTDALTDLLETVIDAHRAQNQGVVFLAHSMGTVFAARLANPRGTHHTTPLPSYVRGIIAICPVTDNIPETTARRLRRLVGLVPDTLFDLWRAWDRRGGPDSASVRRFVGPEADLETRLLQDRFNSQSRSPVFRRMAWGSLRDYSLSASGHGGMFGQPTWDAELDIPLFLIGGGEDHVTPPANVATIERVLTKSSRPQSGEVSPSSLDETDERDGSRQQEKDESPPSPTTTTTPATAALGDAAAPVNPSTNLKAHQKIPPIRVVSKDEFDAGKEDDKSHDDPSTPGEHNGSHDMVPPMPERPTKIVRTAVLPGAGHAMLYTPVTVRILSGMVRGFLEEAVTGRFSLSWQLKYLSREDKWDVKNVEKWLKVEPVSEPIGGIFRAMKTLREVDEVHTPIVFSKNWAHTIRDVVDISHANPTYDPKSFQMGIKYHKFPTVSKIPPTTAEVAGFVALIDQILEAKKSAAAAEGNEDDDKTVIGVHCHYGFNRTGFFVVSYLVERRGYAVNEAIQAFAQGRPNGIRHGHFLDELYLRYSSSTSTSAAAGPKQ